VVALVSVETVLLVLLIVLVAALLRSHAELLRRLGPEGTDPPRLPEPSAGARGDTVAPELAGVTPTGDAIKLALTGPSTLLAFLSSGCTSCRAFWEKLGDSRPAPELRTVIVTHGAEREQLAKLRRLASDSVPVVMSSQAWDDYGVPGTPYFVLIEDGAIRGEGVATTWDALASLIGDAVEDERGLDERLTAVGVGPGHASLYPGGRR
jgi:hypothetical protein